VDLSEWISPFTLRKRGILGMNRRNVAYITRYNDRSRYPLVDDKLKTKLVAAKAGVTVPELLHVIRTQHEIETIDEVLAGLTQFVIKPSQGSGGKGILVIVGKEGDAFVKSSGALLHLIDVKRHLSNVISGLYSLGGRTDIAFVESLVVSDDIFKHVSYEGVPDIRLIVFKGYPIMGMLRLATKRSDGKANLHQGAVGVGLDIGTGRSIAAVQFNRPIEVHPDTGNPVTNIQVPNWRRMLILAARCYDVTQLGYLGADLVLDKRRGPLLLELNARPGLTIQVANDEGLLPRLRHIEKLEEVHVSVDERVDYVMQHFAKLRTPVKTLWEEPLAGQAKEPSSAENELSATGESQAASSP
jgi:alpha-L-glutamate ligase-like protein